MKKGTILNLRHRVLSFFLGTIVNPHQLASWEMIKHDLTVDLLVHVFGKIAAGIIYLIF